MSDFYNGGIPMQGGTNLFPSEAGSQAFVNPELKAQASPEGASNGGPASFSGSSQKGFVDDSNYMTSADMRNSESSMKIIDLNTVVHTV